MPLWLLGLLVAGGISLIVYLVHAGGGSKVAVLRDDAHARERWAQDFPDFVPEQVLLARDGSAAFIRLKNGAGLVTAVGDCFLTRLLNPSDIAKVDLAGPELNVRLNDFTYSGGRWLMAAEADARQAADWLSQIWKQDHA